MLRRLLPGYAPPAGLDRGTEVLVAGCGTGYQPIRWALSYRDIRVVGVDLSRRSLAYAARMARGLGVTNLELMQGDILDLGGLGRRFPIIVCTGVLHHMEDPMAAWAALSEHLAPGGLMKLGLYSERARTSIVRARARIAARGLEPVAPDIRAFRRDVLLGREGPDFEDLVESRPFYNLSGARDLLFHVMEHRHSLPEIARTIERLSLRFLGFEIEEPSVKRRYGEQFPADREMTDLACWESFEQANPDAFAGMYQFWCEKPAAS
jgi:SAM-dependent methyltransferase